MARKIFNMMNGVGSRTNPFIAPGARGKGGPDTRDPGDEDPVWGTGNVAPPEETGQGQWGPGWQSGSASLVDFYGGHGSWEDLNYMDDGEFQSGGISNMNDLYDMWASGSNSMGMSNYDSFMDWFTQLGSGYYDDEGNMITDETAPGYMYSPGESSSELGWNISGSIIPGSGYGGGAQGGSGDLGTGSSFAGGGMGSSLFGPGITNPFGEGWGPEGQDEWEPPDWDDWDWGEPENPEGYGIDPDWNPWGNDCLAMWQQSGAADSYEDFAAAMCG